MAIRLRNVNGELVALCAARSVEKQGDIYLDDAAHHALSNKFALDWNSSYGLEMPFDQSHADKIEQEESNNPNREWWDSIYGQYNTR